MEKDKVIGESTRRPISSKWSTDLDRSSAAGTKQPREETEQVLCREHQQNIVRPDTLVKTAGTMDRGGPTEKHLQPSAGGAKNDEVLLLSPWQIDIPAMSRRSPPNP